MYHLFISRYYPIGAERGASSFSIGITTVQMEYIPVLYFVFSHSAIGPCYFGTEGVTEHSAKKLF